MQVNSIRSYSAPRVAFGNEGEAAEKKQINKKAVIAAGATAAAAVAAVGTTAYALHRGKVVTEGKEAKFFAKLKEGFKSFAGEGRKNYLEKLKANLQDMIDNGKKAKDGTVTELTKEAAEKVQNKIKKLDEKINKITENLTNAAETVAAEGAKAAPEGEKAVAEGVETIVEDVQAAQ